MEQNKKNVVIVESPSKSHTIEKYLGSDFKVLSSKGHIRDLATSGKFGLGVDVDNNFKPDYIPIAGKKKVITELKAAIKDADMVYLATDPDREGEAISWHLYDALKIKEDNYKRVLFHEITKDKVREAMNNPMKIDYNLVKSQEDRRILDRIMGFRLSKLVRSKTGGKSAGRVQSVALKLIVDREREIAKFNPEEYWSITAIFDKFEAKLFNYNHEDIKITSIEEVDKILADLGDEFVVDSIKQQEKAKKSKAPFTTSTLQQEASSKLGFNAKKTMSIAQKLYEGMDIDNERVGLITYMRTDSIRLSDEFVKTGYKYINDNFGSEYIGYVKTGKKKDNVQDAHEGIRPTSVFRTPLSVKQYLTPDEYKLYKLIYVRALSSIMKDAKVMATTIVFDNNNYQFKTTGQILIFDGYLKLYKDYEKSDDVILPEIKEDNKFVAEEIKDEQHFTKPPARYTEAKLIKELEELGIGRPSTYAKIMDIIRQRDYVKIEDKKFIPTEVGIETTDKLQEFFSKFINVEYTANMEEDLDKVAVGKLDNVELLKNFYKDFEPIVEEAFGKMEKKAPIETGEVCPECGSVLVIRNGKYGEFTACSNYPTCKYIKKDEKEVNKVATCPNCGKYLVERKTKKGKIFYGCSNFPKCKTAYWDLPLDEKCPKCGKILLQTKDKIKCSECEYEKD